MRHDALKRPASGALLRWRPEKGVACGFVVLIHLLLAWAVTRPMPIADNGAPSMELVFIRLLPLPANPPSPAQARSRTPTALAEERRSSSPTTKARRTLPTDALATIPQTTAEDRWDLSASQPHKDDGIRFARNTLPSGFNPIRMGPRERFRMREPLSLASFMRAIAQTIFWPPGYTDDPCPGLKKAVQTLSEASTEREIGLLEDAVLLESRYCR